MTIARPDFKRRREAGTAAAPDTAAAPGRTELPARTRWGKETGEVGETGYLRRSAEKWLKASWGTVPMSLPILATAFDYRER